MDGYKFWKEKLNGAKLIVAPMVDQRMLSRKYGAELCYTPMLHASVFVRDATYRKDNFTTCAEDRPLIVQFCSDDPDTFCNAALLVQNDCDAVDLNLGCPQGIARRGHYGSFLQDEWELIFNILEKAVKKLKVPVTAKIRVFEDIEKTVEYAKTLEKAGVSLLTVHGRTREQKGAETGLASWDHIKAVKENVKIPVFANGNILFLKNVYECMNFTGCDGVMIAEGSLQNPCLFNDLYPSVWEICREYMIFVKSYDCPLTWLRGHIFKMCRKVFDIHTELREKLAKAKTIELVQVVIDDIEKICLNTENISYSKNELKYYWQCQPYIRDCYNEKNNETIENSQITNGDKINDDTVSKSEKNLKEEIQSKRKKRKLDKLAKKQNSAINLVKHKKTKYENCLSCNNPKSKVCDHDMCRKCCIVKIYENNLECKGHKLGRKRENNEKE